MKRFWLFSLAVLTALNINATQTQRWSVDTAKELLQGRGDGVAVTADGRLVPVPGWRTAAKLSSPIALAGLMEKEGTVLVGTGHPAGIYRLRGNKLEELAKVPAEQVTAMLRIPSGRVLVTTTGPALVLEWNGTKLRKLGDLDDGGFWDLAWFDGVVVAAAGPPATLYHVTEKGLERWLELPDTHARSLAVDGDLLLVGTSGKGLILRVDRRGVVGMVADSPFTEIADLVGTPDGSVWAAAVVGEPGKAKPAKPVGKKAGKATAAVTVSPSPLKLPKLNGATASSELLRVTPDGAILSVHRFAEQVVSALAWDGTGVLVGTGYEGEVWRFGKRGGTRLTVLDAVQVTAILGGGQALVTQGPAAILRRTGPETGGGTFRSAVERFRRPVAFGRFRVGPPAKGVRIRFRSGLTGQPDPSWLPWSDWLPAGDGKVPLAPATSLQWEVEIPGGVERAVERVEVAYREVNLAPRIRSVDVEPPGVIYLAASPPTGQFVDVSHPDFNGIFTTLQTDQTKLRGGQRGKRYWRLGYRTVMWKAKDPNQDPVRFDLAIESRDGFSFPVRKGLKQTQLAVDTTAIPDGEYRVRLTVTDAPGNPAHPATDTALSRWFVVDNSPPAVKIRKQGEKWRVVAEDALSAISRAQWSRDGGRWKALAPDDGMVDERREVFHISVAKGKHVVVVRVIDRHHNRAVASAVEE